jgi:hypothetical protein
MTTNTEPKAEPRIPLSKQRVLSAAVALADRTGVGSLSMRKLAQELGVEAMSLYHHITKTTSSTASSTSSARSTCRPATSSGSGHATEGDLGPRDSPAPPVGHRLDGFAVPGPGDVATPRRRARNSAKRRFLDRDGRSRVLRARQLHLRIPPAGDEPAVRNLRGARSGGGVETSSSWTRPCSPARWST